MCACVRVCVSVVCVSVSVLCVVCCVMCVVFVQACAMYVCVRGPPWILDTRAAYGGLLLAPPRVYRCKGVVRAVECFLALLIWVVG